MKSTGTINIVVIASACFVIALTTASCDGRRVGDEQIAPAATKESAKESKKELSRDEMLEVKFRQIMHTTYSEVTLKNAMVASRAVGKILDEIAQFPVDESLPLLDRFMDMVLETSLDPVTSYPSQYKYSRPIHIARIAWFEKMFYITRQTFYTSIELRKEPYENWEKLFAFFGKFTNEVAKVSSCQPTYNSQKQIYLQNLKDNFKMYVHVVRDIELLHHKTKPTEKQKAEIFRRFEELEEYVEKLVPPRKPWIEEQKMLNPQSTPPSPPPQNSNPKRFDGRYTM